jgi:hypothetical protein
LLIARFAKAAPIPHNVWRCKGPSLTSLAAPLAMLLTPAISVHRAS